ncbi:MAG: hypothetical protein A2341_10755 [Deltaproteobacteria bacterium RIFOXYB12_FULL_58_9]|nr:MAG: hypothetical protein A2341_10755 [Deltaproteobacteria bacterium RIFOXYB12_FULL_58_9]
MAGCTSTDSEFVDTDGITAIFDVEVAEQDGGATVWAILHQGDADSSTYVKMSGGDKLIAAVSVAGGQYTSDKEMDEQQAFGSTAYRADFSDFDDGSEEFKIEFDRSGSGKDSALASTVVLPPKFGFSGFQIDQVDVVDTSHIAFSRSSQDFYVQWDPFNPSADYDMGYEVDGPCIAAQTVGTADVGGYEFDPNTIRSATGKDAETCQVTFRLIRSNDGTVDSAFMGGKFKASQIREFTFTSAP